MLLKGEDADNLRKFLRSPVFIPKTMSIEKAFLTLQAKRQSYAIVTNRLSDIVGVVPIESLLIMEKR